MKLNVVETRRIRPVVRPSRLRQDLADFGIRSQRAPHPVCQFHGLVQRDALRKRCPDIDGTFVQLRQELRA